MDARELRLGNYISVLGNTVEVIKIFGERKIEVHSDILQFWDVDIEEDDMDVLPIPLTEEWLDKMKFRKYNNIRFEHDMLLGDIVKDNGFYLANVTPEIKWVHQLQNAFYAITGEELEVKP